MTHDEGSENHDEALDGLLRRAMSRRAVDAPGIDIAAEAMGRVRVQDARARQLLSLSRWLRLSGLAAGLLLALSVAIAVMKTSTSTDSSGSTGAAEMVTALGSSSFDMQGPALMLLGLAIVGVAVAVVMQPDRGR